MWTYILCRRMYIPCLMGIIFSITSGEIFYTKQGDVITGKLDFSDGQIVRVQTSMGALRINISDLTEIRSNYENGIVVVGHGSPVSSSPDRITGMISEASSGELKIKTDYGYVVITDISKMKHFQLLQYVLYDDFLQGNINQWELDNRTPSSGFIDKGHYYISGNLSTVNKKLRLKNFSYEIEFEVAEPGSNFGIFFHSSDRIDPRIDSCVFSTDPKNGKVWLGMNLDSRWEENKDLAWISNQSIHKGGVGTKNTVKIIAIEDNLNVLINNQEVIQTKMPAKEGSIGFWNITDTGERNEVKDKTVKVGAYKVHMIKIIDLDVRSKGTSNYKQ